jgi:hypothetical protein
MQVKYASIQLFQQVSLSRPKLLIGCSAPLTKRSWLCTKTARHLLLGEFYNGNDRLLDDNADNADNADNGNSWRGERKGTHTKQASDLRTVSDLVVTVGCRESVYRVNGGSPCNNTWESG